MTVWKKRTLTTRNDRIELLSSGWGLFSGNPSVSWKGSNLDLAVWDSADQVIEVA